MLQKKSCNHLPYLKKGLVMEFFCKGGEGGLDPIYNFEAHFFVPQELGNFCVE